MREVDVGLNSARSVAEVAHNTLSIGGCFRDFGRLQKREGWNKSSSVEDVGLNERELCQIRVVESELRGKRASLKSYGRRIRSNG